MNHSEIGAPPPPQEIETERGEKYRIVDGRMEIFFPSRQKWIRQEPSEWDSAERWWKAIEYHTAELVRAKKVIQLFGVNLSESVAGAPPERTPPEITPAHLTAMGLAIQLVEGRGGSPPFVNDLRKILSVVEQLAAGGVIVPREEIEERVAEAIYDVMREYSDEGKLYPWVQQGNSLKQDEARKRARSFVRGWLSDKGKRE